jgi:hypothetical protein
MRARQAQWGRRPCPTTRSHSRILPWLTLPSICLFGITTSKVRPELQAKILRDHRECYRCLRDAFKQEILPTTTDLAPVPPAASGARLAYKLATAVQNLALDQMDMEQRMGGRSDRMTRWVKGVASYAKRVALTDLAQVVAV